MVMTTALEVRLEGVMQQAALLQFRDLLGLEKAGRLTDSEDVDFGFRYLQKDDRNWIRLNLSRQDDSHWQVFLRHLTSPPTDKAVDQILGEIHTAATQLGFTVGEVIRRA